jgi:ribosome-binding protein aMBF1 (putative translation factor)
MSEDRRGIPDLAERERRRLTPAKVPPELGEDYERRRKERETPEYQAALARDIEMIKEEFPPAVPDQAVLEAVAALRLARERLGLSLSDVAERSGLDRSTLHGLEAGKLTNPTYGTMKRFARAVGLRIKWVVERE